MGCVTTPTFLVLINGAASSFFKTSTGLRQGCPLSPYLFLLVAKGLSRAIQDGRRLRLLQGVLLGRGVSLTYLLFVDNVLLFCYGTELECQNLIDVTPLFSRGTYSKNFHLCVHFDE
jgi:hypothetical protein